MKIITDADQHALQQLQDKALYYAVTEPFIEDAAELRRMLRQLANRVGQVNRQLQFEHDMSDADGVTLPFRGQVEVALTEDIRLVYLNDVDITSILPGDELASLEREADRLIEERHDMKRTRMTTVTEK